MLRPRPCRWFELITSRDDLAAALEALARGGAVELQTHAAQRGPLVVAGAAQALAHAHALARTHGRHWPPPRTAGPVRITDPAQTLAARVAQLDAWRLQADPLIAELEHLAAAQQAWADLARLLAAGAAQLPPPGLLAAAGQSVVGLRIHAVARHGPASALPAELLQLLIPGESEDYVLTVGPQAAMALVDAQFAARKARRLAWPAELKGTADEAAQAVAGRLADAGQQRQQLLQRLQALAQQHQLADARADIDLIDWLVLHGAELAVSERLVWVTGWTTAPDEVAFCAPLGHDGLRCVVQFPAPPADAEAPSMLANPPWVRAFEGFARLLGQPGPDEADPSPLVALIAPLLFGFMFGDVGQGAVLCAAGWLLRKRAPMLVLLVPGGLMAMVFGLLFGSVFAREDLIPALWLRPLAEPVALLVAAVGGGAVILLAGLVLNAVQACWRHGLRRWWAGEAGLLLSYLGLLGAPLWWPASWPALWLVPAGALWVAVGSAWVGEPGSGRAAASAAGLAQWVEHALQLVVNTVSFARVGAFALAHAGLSMAVVGVAEASGAIGYWVVLVLGNVLILLLEGLVVGIQTTRLLLFEFFVRFLQGKGRAFRPLPPPLTHATPLQGSPS